MKTILKRSARCSIGGKKNFREWESFDVTEGEEREQTKENTGHPSYTAILSYKFDDDRRKFACLLAC